ncbi:hypothetical protein GGX14DRAFT_455349 [Mycena pura]|uniref:F-box domain-containing protein n=1 Tax=Mycena pura TaxID=153505 RepID=A0AAD6VF99_9AGAR|nr:hypothetical protein GGX14DRAFT_455349 [Mycena pura]
MAPYPVLTLPFDIASQIFVYCLPQEDDALPCRTEAPLLLAGICREWRDIALATHELWNTIHLTLRSHSVSTVSPLLEFWLPRAGNLPLSMSLCYKGNLDDPYSPRMDPKGAGFDTTLVNLLALYAPHWTSLELHISLQALFQVNIRKEAFTSLKKLVLDCGPSLQVVDQGKRMVYAFAEASHLRELHLMSGGLGTRTSFPWGQLTSLKLDNSTIAECLQMLALTLNLVNFTLTLWSSGHLTSAPILPCPRLESLNATLSHSRGPALLSSLTLPALSHLGIDIMTVQEITSFTSLIARSSCFLRRLSVRLGLRWTTDHFLRFLTSLDSLEELEIRKANQSLDTGLRFLQAQPSLLPNLRSLDIERTSGDEDPDLVADFLESRWNVQTSISVPVQMKCFRLRSPLTRAPDFESDAILRLQLLREAGMVIRITSSRSWFGVA